MILPVLMDSVLVLIFVSVMKDGWENSAMKVMVFENIMCPQNLPYSSYLFRAMYKWNVHFSRNM